VDNLNLRIRLFGYDKLVFEQKLEWMLH